MALVFTVMHLYNIKKIFCIASVHSFFKTLQQKNKTKKSGVDKSTQWSAIPACPIALCAFLTGAIPKGLILRKVCV